MGAGGSLLEHSRSQRALQLQESKEEATVDRVDPAKETERKSSGAQLQDSPKASRHNERKQFPQLSTGLDPSASKHPEDTTTDPHNIAQLNISSTPPPKLRALPTGVESLVVGDIVRARLDGPIRYEGVVVDIDVQQEMLKVDFGDTLETVPVEQCIKVLSWDHLELGDQVQVRPDGMFQYFTGKVVRVNLDGTYKIQYADSDDIDDNVHASKIRKLATGRTMASKRWKAVIHAVRTTTALAGLIRKKTRSESFDSAN